MKKIEKICRNCKHWHDIGKTLDVNCLYILNSSISRRVGACDLSANALDNYSIETCGCDKFVLAE